MKSFTNNCSTQIIPAIDSNLLGLCYSSASVPRFPSSANYRSKNNCFSSPIPVPPSEMRLLPFRRPIMPPGEGFGFHNYLMPNKNFKNLSFNNSNDQLLVRKNSISSSLAQSPESDSSLSRFIDPRFGQDSPESDSIFSPRGLSSGGESDVESSQIWKSFTDTPTQLPNLLKPVKPEMEKPEAPLKFRVIRGRGMFSKTNVTSLTNPLPMALCYRQLNKVKSCVFCIKINPEQAKSHNMKENNRVVCPSLRAYTCPICGTPDKDASHTVRFCPKNHY